MRTEVAEVGLALLGLSQQQQHVLSSKQLPTLMTKWLPSRRTLTVIIARPRHLSDCGPLILFRTDFLPESHAHAYMISKWCPMQRTPAGQRCNHLCFTLRGRIKDAAQSLSKINHSHALTHPLYQFCHLQCLDVAQLLHPGTR